MASATEAHPFGLNGFLVETTEPSSIDKTVNEPSFFNQASGHPIALTSRVQFTTEEVGASKTLAPTRDLKDLTIDLPPGLLANPQALPRCTLGRAERCPTDTQVGMFVIHAGALGGGAGLLGPIVNVTPYGGVSAELGLETPFQTFPLIARLVQTPEGYTSSIVARGLPVLGVTSMEITLWGVPAAPVHDPLRGVSCFGSEFGGAQSFSGCADPGAPDSEEPAAFLTMPSSCSETPTATVWADSWEEPGRYVKAESTLPTMAYCERLPYTPEISVRPETITADQPLGANLSIQVPQLGNGTILSTPPLRDATITLPQGVAINAGVGDGLQACDATGPTGINIPTGLGATGEQLQPGEVGPGEEIPPPELGPDEPELAPGHCPNASIVGKVQAVTPQLAHPIEGRVFIATPGCGGVDQAACTEQDAVDGNLYRLYIELGGKNTERRESQGVLIKLQASVTANPATGQLSVRLTNMPQLPISNLSIQLYGGDRALLANPATCGPATSTADLEPWGAPLTPSAAPSSYYDVTGCSDPPTLNPSFLAGSLNVAAGAFTPFTLTVTRKDGEQNLAGLQVHTPPGLSAMLASVPLCPQALASSGACPEVSRVGGSEVAAGSGTQPLYLPGNVYLTGPFDGSPFGLSIVTDAQAGPLNLGRLVIRARIDLDPTTAALTITTDALPQIVLGVPLRIQKLRIDLDRANFIVNPTNCDQEQINATIAGARGEDVSVSNRFALADCTSLTFKPKLTATTSAHTTLTGGASLDLHLALSTAMPGTDANLARIKVALPSRLPPRLTSLQNSCLMSTFDRDPSACPAAAIVGIARARTPMLPGELAGPVYLVAHGHAAFPSPVVVIQGDGVTLELSGSTNINEVGSVSVTFNATPDVPLTSLELLLPASPHSLLAAPKSLCVPVKARPVKRTARRRARGRKSHAVTKRETSTATLPMGTELIAHNGAVVRSTTQIIVKGCSAHQLRSSQSVPVTLLRSPVRRVTRR